MAKTSSIKKDQYIFTIGRRRTSAAKIKFFTGKGENSVNGIAVDKYFPGVTYKISYEKPFTTTDTLAKYHYQAKVNGGGLHGQLTALTLAIARALKKIDATFTSPLRQQGLLTVDSRVRQRRMVGTGGKARRAKQSPKR